MGIDIDVVRKIDLIDFFRLTEEVAAYHKMSEGEAFDWIFTKIMEGSRGRKTQIFDTSWATLPKIIEEIYSEMDSEKWNASVLNEIWDTNFWRNENEKINALKRRFRKHDNYLKDAAILKSDAVDLFNIPFSLLSAVDLRADQSPKLETITDKIAPAENLVLYSTKWLEIQQAAISQFFNPRRNPDAKKDEVVEWINTQAVNAGLGESNNIASTIFTIIKPDNHDPKKKRIEPRPDQ